MPNLITLQARNHPPRHKSHGKSILSQQLALFAPDYAATPYWSLESVHPDESLPGQRYRLNLRHDKVSRSLPVQLFPEEAIKIFEAVRRLQIECDFKIDLDGTGQIADDEARSALYCLLGALLGGEVDE
jgi:hypothetical protein